MSIELDLRMKEAGMLTVDEMLQKQGIDTFIKHDGVNDLESFQTWLDMKTREYLGMKAKMILDKEEDDDLFEWVLSHCAAFNAVRVNFRAAIEKQVEENS